MKKNLVIIGNSSAAVECYWLAQKMIESGEPMEIKGFLSFEGYKGQLYELASMQLGVDDDYAIQPDDVFCIGIGQSGLRLKAYEKWKKRGAKFINLVHPNCEILGNNDLGEANIFISNAFISSNVDIGNANYFSPNIIISHDVKIGNGNFFYPQVIILEYCQIASGNQFGVHAVMLPKTKLGSRNVIEEEANIKNNFGDDNILAGNPAIQIDPKEFKNDPSGSITAQKTINAWETTTTDSDIYVEYNKYIESSRNLSAPENETLLKSLIDKNLNSNIDLSLLFLNEYEINFGTTSSYYKLIEKALEDKYNNKLSKCGRPTCKLLDATIENSGYNIDYFKNLHKNERCFIIGNGPSLNKLDLKKLENEITFGVNSIFLNFDKMGFQPTYYTVEDSHVIRERAQQIAKIDKSIKFIPQYAKRHIKPDPHTIYFNCICDYRRYAGFPLFSVDAAKRLWCGGTVSYLNIQLALYMGFSEVCLIGFDHHYVIPESAKVDKFDIVSSQDDPNHFHPDYFGKGFSWHVPLVNRMELGYIKAKHVYEKKDVKICNATPGGHLNVFPRVDYNSLF